MIKIEQPITGYKAFDANLKCRDFQYEIGKEYDTDTVKICETGFHFCERAIDVFNYYLPSSRFCIVTGWGTIDREDNKVAVSNIRIEKEITLHELIEATVNSTVGAVSNSGNYGAASNSGYGGAASNSGNRGAASNSGDYGAASNSGYQGAASNSGNGGAASNSGDYGAASNSGNYGAASNSGDYGAASNSGYRGAASNSGYGGAASNSGYQGAAMSIGTCSSANTNAKDSVAAVFGYDCKASGSLGSWIVLTERNDMGEILDMKLFKVDGSVFKENTFYKLKNKQITEI